LEALLTGLLDLEDFNAFFGLAMGAIPLNGYAKLPRLSSHRTATGGATSCKGKPFIIL